VTRRTTVKETEKSAAKTERRMPVDHGQESKPEPKLPDDVKYIDILVEITLNFIRAEYPDKG
jgi:hypothetical protein|tara:strand:- start:236 stop:421 length:186 start_codon:yes stop_codon:yes gene_type:complete